MITKEFPSLRPKPTYNNSVVEFGKHKNPPYAYTPPGSPRVPTAQDRAKAEKVGITPEEVVRRDNIVRQMWLATKFHVGEQLVAKTEANRKLYGRMHIRGIYKSYHDFHEAEAWPKDDTPYIITCDSELKGAIVCTADFLARETNGSAC